MRFPVPPLWLLAVVLVTGFLCWQMFVKAHDLGECEAALTACAETCNGGRAKGETPGEAKGETPGGVVAPATKVKAKAAP